MKRIFSTILAVMLLMGLMAVPSIASGLTIVSSSVLDGDKAAPVSALITFKFSENIADVTNNPITLVKDGSDTNLVKSFTGADDVLKIYLDAELEYNTNYTLNLGPVSSTNALNSLSDSEITFKTRYAAEGTIIEEDLEDGGFKELKDDLEGKAGVGSLVQKDGDSGNWSYKIQGGTIGVNSAAQKTTSITGKFIFEMDFFPDNVQYDYSFFQFVGNMETRKLLMYDADTQKIGVLYNTNSASSNSSALVAGKEIKAGWNNIKALVDLNNQNIKLYVNNSLVVDGNGNSEFLFPCYSNLQTKGESIYYFRINNSKISDGVYLDIYVDNISVRQINAQCYEDNQPCTLTASNPNVKKMVRLDSKTFELTFNHCINVHSLKNVTINGTAVKSFTACDNKITAVLPDDYQLEMYRNYTFDFCLAEDVYGCAVPDVTFATKTNYSMTEVNFEDEFDSNIWETYKYKDAYDSTVGIVPEAGNEENSVLHFNRTLGTNEKPGNEDIRFRRKDSAPWFDINGNAVFGFSIKINSLDWNGRTDYNFISLYDYTAAPTETKPDNYASTSLDWILQIVKKDEENTFDVKCSEYLTVDKNGKTERTFQDSGVDVSIGEWLNLLYEFDFERMEYYTYINETKTGPYSFKTNPITGLDSVIFYGSTMAINCYIDNISLGQKFFADTDYDFGFFNADNAETTVVDPVKTTYRATIVNRGKSADNTKLILTVTNEDEKRLSEVRLISFADLEENKNGQNEIIIEEEFENLGTGKKIKAFFWQDFASLRPSAASTRLLPLVAEAVSAN